MRRFAPDARCRGGGLSVDRLGYDRLKTKGYIKRSSQPPSTEDILYEITDAGKATLRAVGGTAE